MYTINGKEYTEFDINKRCAELMGIQHQIEMEDTPNAYIYSEVLNREYAPLNNPQDTWPIIEKYGDYLLEPVDSDGSDNSPIELMACVRWQYLTEKHNCSKLVAACICFIEINGVSDE